MNRASAREKGNSGRSGAICSEILPFSVERERLTESFRISLVHSSFQRSRSFLARPSIALICWRKKRYAATRPRRKAIAITIMSGVDMGTSDERLAERGIYVRSGG